MIRLERRAPVSQTGALPCTTAPMGTAHFRMERVIITLIHSGSFPHTMGLGGQAGLRGTTPLATVHMIWISEFHNPLNKPEGEEKNDLLKCWQGILSLVCSTSRAAIFPNMNLKRNITLRGRVKNWHTAFPPVYNNIRIGGIRIKYFLFYFGDWEKISTYKIKSKLIVTTGS